VSEFVILIMVKVVVMGFDKLTQEMPLVARLRKRGSVNLSLRSAI
jgi:hypothetical protein